VLDPADAVALAEPANLVAASTLEFYAERDGAIAFYRRLVLQRCLEAF